MGMGNQKIALVLLITSIPIAVWYFKWDEGEVSVAVNGVNHMGPRYSISEFYIDGSAFGNVGPDGGGGSAVCCALLPKSWRPGLSVELRWEVADHLNRRNTPYKAVAVPIEKYDDPEDIVVHFFRDRSIRVISSSWSVSSANHPIAWGVSDGGTLATKGRALPESFSHEELAQPAKRYKK